MQLNKSFLAIGYGQTDRQKDICNSRVTFATENGGNNGSENGDKDGGEYDGEGGGEDDSGRNIGKGGFEDDDDVCRMFGLCCKR